MWYVRNLQTGAIVRTTTGAVKFFPNYRAAERVASRRGKGWTASIGTKEGPHANPV